MQRIKNFIMERNTKDKRELWEENLWMRKAGSWRVRTEIGCRGRKLIFRPTRSNGNDEVSVEYLQTSDYSENPSRSPSEIWYTDVLHQQWRCVNPSSNMYSSWLPKSRYAQKMKAPSATSALLAQRPEACVRDLKTPVLLRSWLWDIMECFSVPCLNLCPKCTYYTDCSLILM